METEYFPYPCGQEITNCKIAHRVVSCGNKDWMVKKIFFKGK